MSLVAATTEGRCFQKDVGDSESGKRKREQEDESSSPTAVTEATASWISPERLMLILRASQLRFANKAGGCVRDIS